MWSLARLWRPRTVKLDRLLPVIGFCNQPIMPPTYSFLVIPGGMAVQTIYVVEDTFPSVVISIPTFLKSLNNPSSHSSEVHQLTFTTLGPCFSCASFLSHGPIVSNNGDRYPPDHPAATSEAIYQCPDQRTQGPRWTRLYQA